MKKIIILIPVFNDWESLIKLLKEIDENIKDIKNISFKCLVVNDASTIKQPDLQKPKNISSLKILNMKTNKGHARCNAFGIRFINDNEKFDYIILMDGDGEDRPEEIKSLIDKIKQEPKKSVVAKRIKRSEGPFFQMLYKIHKLVTLLFTGKNINFGNYSCITKNDANILSTKASLWSSYSGSVKKNILYLNEVNSQRGIRYFGPSQMSFFKLLIHSFSIIAVFKYFVFLRSIIFILLFFLLKSYLGKILFLFIFLILLFNFLIFMTSLRESETELSKSQLNLKNITEITH
jgi:GT2 family glycosyltransferase